MNAATPRIAIDALGIDQPGGGRTAVLYLFRALFELRPDWQITIFLSRREPLLGPFGNVRQIIVPGRKGIWARLLMQALMPYWVWRHRVDLVHFAKSQGSKVWRTKTVLTLFDATTLRHPEIHSHLAVWYWRNLQPIMARWSDAIVTLTNHAARDLQELLTIPASKITVVPCASQFASLPPAAPIPQRVSERLAALPETYLLFVGMLALKKNLTTLIRAMAVLRQRQTRPPVLILAGPRRYELSDASTQVFDLIKQLDVETLVRYVGEVDEASLPELYRRARLFVMPSLHEGFGIPCLEAMACGTPVIAARASALPEVVGDAGVLVDEYLSPEAWAMQIEQLLADSARHADLAERGKRRAQSFNWRCSAQILAQLYEQLLARPSLS